MSREEAMRVLEQIERGNPTYSDMRRLAEVVRALCPDAAASTPKPPAEGGVPYISAYDLLRDRAERAEAEAAELRGQVDRVRALLVGGMRIIPIAPSEIDRALAGGEK